MHFSHEKIKIYQLAISNYQLFFVSLQQKLRDLHQ